MANNRNDSSVPILLATQSVILAAIGNSVLKGCFALSLGSPRLRRQVALVLGLIRMLQRRGILGADELQRYIANLIEAGELTDAPPS